MSLDIKYLVFACYLVKCSSKVICKSLYSILIYVLHSVTALFRIRAVSKRRADFDFLSLRQDLEVIHSVSKLAAMVLRWHFCVIIKNRCLLCTGYSFKSQKPDAEGCMS